MHQEEFSSMSSYLNDIQLMALKVIPGYCQQNMVPSGKIALRALLLKKPEKPIYHSL